MRLRAREFIILKAKSHLFHQTKRGIGGLFSQYLAGGRRFLFLCPEGFPHFSSGLSQRDFTSFLQRYDIGFDIGKV